MAAQLEEALPRAKYILQAIYNILQHLSSNF